MEGSGNGASLSMGVLLGEPGRGDRALLLGTIKVMKKSSGDGHLFP